MTFHPFLNVIDNLKWVSNNSTSSDTQKINPDITKQQENILDFPYPYKNDVCHLPLNVLQLRFHDFLETNAK